MKSASRANTEAASANITERIQELGDWRGETLARVRQLIHDADPDIQEEWKWRGVPVWSHDGIVCTGESYKQVVKLTFARGASIEDPKKLFNSSLEGNTRRAIDIREGEKIADPLKASGVFPAMVLQMISVGEETGNLEIMLNKIADFYDDEVDSAVANLTSLMEPFVIVFLGVVIGGLVIAMYLPIFKLGAIAGG